MFEEKLLENISSDEDDEIGGIASSKTMDLIMTTVDSTQPICPPPPPPPILLPMNIASNQEFQSTSSNYVEGRRQPIPLDRNETQILSKIKHHFQTTPKSSMDFGKTEHEQDWMIKKEEADNLSVQKEEFERIIDSPYWTQSIAPGKFYKRTRNSGQVATSALCALQQQFSQKVIGTIRDAQERQPKSEPTALSNFHQNCSNCSNHQNNHSHSENDDDDYVDHSDGNRSNISSSSSSISSTAIEESEEEGELANSTEEEIEKRRRKRSGGRNKRERRRRSNSIERDEEKWRHKRKEKKSIINIASRNEIERKRNHPAALHPDIGFNEKGQLNDGPLCKCSWAARQSGVRHGKYQGEKRIPKCDWQSSNIDRLHHYVLQLDPNPAQFTRQFTQIQMDGHSYQFDGFSVFFHQPLPEYFPQRPINQWTQQFQIRFINENAPESFTVNDLELFHTFLFDKILELYDLDRNLNIPKEEGDPDDFCFFYHCLPRFARKLPDNGKELLPMSSVLSHFLTKFSPLIDTQLCRHFRSYPRALSEYVRKNKGQICVNPIKKPMAIRMDLLEAAETNGETFQNNDFPMITHFGIKPTAYAYMKKPEYQDALHKLFELRKKLAKKTQPISIEEKCELKKCKELVETLKSECKARRDLILHLSSRNFYSTGFFPDIVQHALFLVLTCQHVRFHCSLDSLERQQLDGYIFRNRSLLELALIHPSFRTNYGTNPDHVKNVLNNCGIRMSKFKTNDGGNYQTAVKKMPPPLSSSSPSTFCSTPKSSTSTGRGKGIRMLMEIMAMQGCHSNNTNNSPERAQIGIRHNERLEFLGDTVVELLTTVHLFFMFNDLDEGGLATFRSALVQNRHLATLADRLGLQHYMVYAHGPDLCHEADLRHAMANTFEALMAAIYLDSGLAECDRIFASTLFKDDPKLLSIWNNLPEHPLKRNSPFGDRHLIDSIPCLKQLSKFEESIGIRFKHIRLLAKAFTRRNVPYNYLTLGHNQRLEFLGDTILQLLTTDYLYRHFPYHQEGHLSLLRTCLVSNRTQSVVCDDLAMANYLVVPKAILRKCHQAQLRLKDKADLVESFLGALYIDRGLHYCRQFCKLCFFPRLEYFILNQSWNDPKSRLQQCCLTLRDPKARGDPEIPRYKTIGIEGPTNTRIYRVAVYFRKKRLAIGCGASMHIAQMEAAKNALSENEHLFPTIFHQNDATNKSRKRRAIY